MKTIIGTCSNCKGPVIVYKSWFGVKSSIPECENCGARSFGPEIPMGIPRELASLKRKLGLSTR